MQVQALSPTMNAVNGRLLIFSGNVVSLMAAQSFVPPGAAADTAENLQFASQIAWTLMPWCLQCPEQKDFTCATSLDVGVLIFTSSPSIAPTHPSMTPWELILLKPAAAFATSTGVSGNLKLKASH